MREHPIETLVNYHHARHGALPTLEKIEEIIERETGGVELLESCYETIPGTGGFEVLKPTFDAYL